MPLARFLQVMEAHGNLQGIEKKNNLHVFVVIISFTIYFENVHFFHAVLGLYI